MTSFAVVTGAAVPLQLDNVDTDAVIRIDRLAHYGRTELGAFVFESMRLNPDGSVNKNCVLNQPQFVGAPILVAGRNFGCGSSREGAVWALKGFGFRSVIAESFGDIFYNNCFQDAVLPIRLSKDEISELMSQCADGRPVTVDLQQCQVTFPDGSAHSLTVDPMKRASLLDGLDDVSRTLRKTELIKQWQASDRVKRPWVWDPVMNGDN